MKWSGDCLPVIDLPRHLTLHLPSPLGRKRAHADPAWLNDGKVSSPISSFVQPGSNDCTHIRGTWHRNPEKHNATGCWQAGAPCKLAKVLVERDQYSALSYRPNKNIFVHASWRCNANPNDIVPSRNKCAYRIPTDILVGEKSHVMQQDRPFPILERRARRQDCQILAGESRIVAQNLGFRPAFRHKANNKVD